VQRVQASVLTIGTFCGQARKAAEGWFCPIVDKRVGSEPLPIALRFPRHFCFLLSAFCFLLSAFCFFRRSLDNPHNAGTLQIPPLKMYRLPSVKPVKSVVKIP
jgi:hypothetical protein